MTDSPLLPRRTVSRPSHAWNPTSPTAANDGHRIDAPIAMVEERQEGEPEDLEPDDHGDRAMDPLDPGLGVVEGRDQLAVTERPVGATQPGIGGAHDDPDRDQPESGREGQRGELLEAVHGPSFYPGGRFGPTAIP